MKIIQITPGAGGMYCGNCFRDNALVGAWRKLGHESLMVPLYLPLTLDEEDFSAGTPIFFGGINVYLEQKSAWFRKAPAWLHRILDSPLLLKWAAGSAAKTRAEDVGELTLSMVCGEEGRQARELDKLIAWLHEQEKPGVVCLSNCLLLGLVRRLKRDLAVPVVCLLAGEDAFLDGLPEPQRGETWAALTERAAEVDSFVAPSAYYAEVMQRRLGLPSSQVQVVPNGINLEGYAPASALPSDPPVLGYFARMCREKGLDLLVEAYRIIRKRGRIARLKLRVGGSMGPADQRFVQSLRNDLERSGLAGDTEFLPNLDRSAKQDFFRSLTVFSVPALYGEAFGLYLVEAMASGVPVVQPRHAAFPELIEMTKGGLVCDATAQSLAEIIESVLLNPSQARSLGAAGRQAAVERFGIDPMAKALLRVLQQQPANSNLALRDSMAH